MTKMNVLKPLDIEIAVNKIKQFFEKQLESRLSLIKVCAPLFVQPSSGLNDDLSGVEEPVVFRPKHLNSDLEVIQSLAKWKRLKVLEYSIEPHKGIYADMRAIRKDEILSNTHSLLVDQFDWELRITENDRNIDFLMKTVATIYSAIRDTEVHILSEYPTLGKPSLPEDITFIDTEWLEHEYPDLNPKQREDIVAQKYGAVFIMGIGERHDSRASDYDDWNLNGDIIVWYEPLQCALELSSMGIRVNAESLLYQAHKNGEAYKLSLPYHASVLDGTLPSTIGGGIGQSRLCMFMLRRKHIGEVYPSIWPSSILDANADTYFM